MQGPANTVLIRRTKSADYPGNNYFVIDRARGLLGEIALPITQAIVGASATHLYVTTRDADDILRLSRHPWP